MIVLNLDKILTTEEKILMDEITLSEQERIEAQA